MKVGQSKINVETGNARIARADGQGVLIKIDGSPGIAHHQMRQAEIVVRHRV